MAGQVTVSEKRKPISHKVRRAVEALVSGQVKTITAAGKLVGISRENLSRSLSQPHVAAHMHARVQRSLAMGAARASAVKMNLLECDNAMVRDRASTFVLGLAGIQPANQPSVNVNIEVKAGYVIDLSEDPKVINHE